MSEPTLSKNATGQYVDDNGQPLQTREAIDDYLQRLNDLRRSQQGIAPTTEAEDTADPSGAAKGILYAALMDGGSKEPNQPHTNSELEQNQIRQERLLRRKAKKAKKEKGRKRKAKDKREAKPDAESKGPKTATPEDNKPGKHKPALDKPEPKGRTRKNEYGNWRISKTSVGLGVAKETLEDTALPVLGTYAAHRVGGQNRMDSLKGAVKGNSPLIGQAAKDAALDVGMELIPGVTSYRMGKEAFYNFSNGEIKKGLMNTAGAVGWGVVDGVSVGCYVSGVGAPAGAALTGLKAAKIGGKVAKTADRLHKLDKAATGMQYAGAAGALAQNETVQLGGKVLAAELTGDDKALKDLGNEAKGVMGMDGPKPSSHAQHEYGSLKTNLPIDTMDKNGPSPSSSRPSHDFGVLKETAALQTTQNDMPDLPMASGHLTSGARPSNNKSLWSNPMLGLNLTPAPH